MKICKAYKNNGNIMAETVFAGKKVKEFPNQNAFTIEASLDAIFPGLPENLLMRDRPCHTGNWYR
ncbi:hypothetical protein [Pedobacter jamesrossensis]|uniref:Uncharacterized protein n=2 Tax=Pedobacter jamesrossensis TaxID=1908238 RepID=A0ABV8NP91_9SPHI